MIIKIEKQRVNGKMRKDDKAALVSLEASQGQYPLYRLLFLLYQDYKRVARGKISQKKNCCLHPIRRGSIPPGEGKQQYSYPHYTKRK